MRAAVVLLLLLATPVFGTQLTEDAGQGMHHFSSRGLLARKDVRRIAIADDVACL